MSSLKPLKQARMMGQTQVTRTASVNPLPSQHTSAESDPHSSSHPPAQTATSPAPAAEGITPPIAGAASHPKGHKVRELEEVWKAMDGQSYLRLTDTLLLNDVFVQPSGVEVVTGPYVTVTFEQIVVAPNVKKRDNAVAKMHIDDLMRMLYLNEVVQWTLQGISIREFDTWIADKTRAYIQSNGLRDSSNRSALANFIITHDPEFTFYPTILQNCGVYFRKVCYHSYKEKPLVEGETRYKFVNPSMIKCSAKGGKFDYIIEARLVLLPQGWGMHPTIEELADMPPE